MEETSTYTGIYIVSAESVLGVNGYINVINAETDEIIHTFTAEDWNTYTSTNPYKYETPLKNIRIETSSALPGTTLMVYNIKEIDDNKITTTYDEQEFSNLTKVKTYLTGTVIKEVEGTGETEENKTAESEANYEGEVSIVNIKTSKTDLTTQDTEENVLITIETNTQGYNTAKWKNGEFLVKLPTDIAYLEVNNIETSDASVKILGYEVFRNENGNFIKIVTSNENEASYQITIDSNIQADPRISTKEYDVEVYATNENCENYQTGYNAEDIYDINGNSSTSEIVGYNTTKIKLVAPGLLTTAQIASEYDDLGSTTLAPQVAEITPEVVVDSSEKEEQTAKITVQIRNNYTGTVSETKILGKIPFKGNTDGVTNQDLGSTYTTKLNSEGITIPENLQGKITIYYSTNENPNIDLNDTNNGWTTTPEDWSQVKTYLIDFGDYVLAKQEECLFTYEILIPENVNYNQISYSTHKVDFYLDTVEGKISQTVQPRKLGFKVARKYDLELTKYKKGTVETLPGVTFKITELDEQGNEEESKVRTTDENGILNIENLYVDKTYVLKEIKTLTEYDLNEEEIKFRGAVNSTTGELEISVLSGNFKDDKIDITQVASTTEKPVVKVSLENEVKYNLVINKTDSNTNANIKGAKFELQGNEITRRLTTNSKGQINVKGISIGKEYTLTETEATGYYLVEPIKFIVTRNNDGNLNVSLTNENGDIITTENRTDTTYTLEEVERTVCPQLTLNIKNTPIPTYNLNILKISKQTNINTGTSNTETEVKKLEGAQFELYSKDLDKKEIYTTDTEGNISLQGLYEYVEEDGTAKGGITGEYVLKEIYPPLGHSLNVAELTFRAQRNAEGNLILTVISGQDLIADSTETKTGVAYDSTGNEITTKEITITNAETSNPSIQITVENESIFSIEKTDKETGELLQGAKFTIYELDEDYNVIGQAKDVDGNILGKQEEINGQQYYVLTTNESGQITANIGEGYYKAVEVSVPTGYILDSDEANRTYLFGIGKSKPAERITEEVYNNNLHEENGVITFTDSVATGDGGYIEIGYFTNKVTIDGSKTVDGNDIELSTITQNIYSDGLIIKYNKENKVEWAKSYGDGNKDDRFISIAKNYEGNYIVSGLKGNPRYIFHLTYNLDGDLIEEKKDILYTSNAVDITNFIKKIKQTSDNGYIEVLSYNVNITIPSENTVDNVALNFTTKGGYDALIVKYNSEHKVEWAKSFGGTGNDYGYDVEMNENDEYVVVGQITADEIIIPAEDTVNNTEILLRKQGGYDAFIIKYDKDGEVVWAKLLASNANNNETYTSIVRGKNNRYLVIGEAGTITIPETDTASNSSITTSASGTTIILAYNEDGLIEWVEKYNGGGEQNRHIIEATSDGGYLISSNFYGTQTIEASKTSNNEEILLDCKGNWDLVVMKINPNKKVEWAKTFRKSR